MNKETMRKHYETTPKDMVINILISSREEVEKLQSRNKERKQEIERLNNIISELEKWLLEENKKKQKWYNEQLSINDRRYYEEKYLTSLTMINVFFDKLQELKGDE